MNQVSHTYILIQLVHLCENFFSWETKASTWFRVYQSIAGKHWSLFCSTLIPLVFSMFCDELVLKTFTKDYIEIFAFTTDVYGWCSLAVQLVIVSSGNQVARVTSLVSLALFDWSPQSSAKFELNDYCQTLFLV